LSGEEKKTRKKNKKKGSEKMTEKTSEYLGTYIPEFVTNRQRNIIDVNGETTAGNTASWPIKNLRISANNNVVMDVGETEIIVLEGGSEMVKIPHGMRFANAAYRMMKTIGESIYDEAGNPVEFAMILTMLNSWIHDGIGDLILVVSHDEEKGRLFTLEAVRSA
jgi:hypothetical protein